MLAESKQEHYRAGRSITVIQRDQIDAVCTCGYITLKSNGSKLENHCGGLTIKRSQVRIMENGREVKSLRPRNGDIMAWVNCNACVNDWK